MEEQEKLEALADAVKRFNLVRRLLGDPAALTDDDYCRVVNTAACWLKEEAQLQSLMLEYSLAARPVSLDLGKEQLRATCKVGEREVELVLHRREGPWQVEVNGGDNLFEGFAAPGYQGALWWLTRLPGEISRIQGCLIGAVLMDRLRLSLQEVLELAKAVGCDLGPVDLFMGLCLLRVHGSDVVFGQNR